MFTRLATAEYYQRQCELYFPQEGEYTYASKEGKTAGDVNTYTGGWSFTPVLRFMWANGEFDPWRPGGVSSTFRPGGPLPSTANAPVYLMDGAIHCSDLLASNSVHASVNDAQDAEIATMAQWVQDFYDMPPSSRGEGDGGSPKLRPRLRQDIGPSAKMRQRATGGR